MSPPGPSNRWAAARPPSPSRASSSMVAAASGRTLLSWPLHVGATTSPAIRRSATGPPPSFGPTAVTSLGMPTSVSSLSPAATKGAHVPCWCCTPVSGAPDAIGSSRKDSALPSPAGAATHPPPHPPPPRGITEHSSPLPTTSSLRRAAIGSPLPEAVGGASQENSSGTSFSISVPPDSPAAAPPHAGREAACAEGGSELRCSLSALCAMSRACAKYPNRLAHAPGMSAGHQSGWKRRSRCTS
mmetsp:Transcript_35366/g.113936  ORF Transcript_35366/g.113936 Transcript_35366/m.113936 type:complete len:243 (-) Transcript_35366:2199-2927(-)